MSRSRSRRRRAALALLLVCALSAAQGTRATAAGASVRVEARSSDLLAVGLVQGERMNIRLSRLLDNAPVRDAEIKVALRGTLHQTVAEADGSYTLIDKDLTSPGAASVEFQIHEEKIEETLHGMLQAVPLAGTPDDKSNSRQMWWWLLNFAVCIGFLWLFSRRKKQRADA